MRPSARSPRSVDGPVGDDVALLDPVADLHQRLLVDAGRLVRALELHQPIDVDAGLGGVGLLGRAHDDAGGVDLVDDAGAPGRDRRARIARHDRLHAGADKRRVGAHQRHRLPLHVRAHQRAVGVVVLEERDQRRGDRHQLLRRHVHVVDAVARQEHDVSGVTADNQIADQLAGGVDRGIGLGDRIFLLLHRREIGDILRHLAVAHLAVGRFDEAVFVDAREGRERIDQPDVRPLGRFDRADAAIMRRVHVAHLEAGPLAGEAARTQRRKPALVGDLGERVGLVHELRQLRGAEELAHRRGRGLRVDQVLRHDGVDLDRRHALLDRPLHAQEADAILILHQFADRAHPPVAEMVDVVDLAAAVAQVHQRLDHREDVVLAQRALGVGRVEVEAHVHLHPADRREVVALGIEEQRLEHRLGAFDRRRLARAHDAIDVEQGVLARGILVDLERVADIGADIDVVDVEHRQLFEAGLQEPGERLLGDLVAGLGVDFAGLRVIEIFRDILAVEFGVGGAQRLQALLGKLARRAHGQFPAGLDRDLRRCRRRRCPTAALTPFIRSGSKGTRQPPSLSRV